MYVYYIYVGASTVLVPVYLSEISPLRWRGIITSAHQLGTVAAILLVDILSLQEVSHISFKPQLQLEGCFVSFNACKTSYSLF